MQEEKQGGVGPLKYTTQQSNDRGSQYTTIEGGGGYYVIWGRGKE